MNDECFHHGYEPLPENYYKVCLECGHCFLTEEELIKEDEKIMKNIIKDYTPVSNGKNIICCPLCAHDF